jgi:hypothetical protein
MKFERVLREYWEAEESRDLDAISRYYSEKSTLTVPQYGTLKGWGEICTFYEDSIRQYPMLSVEVVNVYGGEEFKGAIEWRSKFGDSGGGEVWLEGVNCVTVDGDIIDNMKVYYDSVGFHSDTRSG